MPGTWYPTAEEHPPLPPPSKGGRAKRRGDVIPSKGGNAEAKHWENRQPLSGGLKA